MELSDYLRIARRSWRLIVAVLLGTVAIAGLWTALSPREYRAETELFISTAGGNTVSDLAQGGSFTQRQVATYADIVTTPAVLGPVIEELAIGQSASDLATRVSATVPPNTVLIDVSVLDEDPVRAAEIANAVATQFAETVEELERTAADGQSPVKATVVRPATPAESPASPNSLRNLALAAALGLLLSLGVALLRDLVDSRVQGESDVARVSDEPTIGAVSFDKEASRNPLVIEINPHSPRAEAFRALRTNLMYLDPDNAPRVLLMTSSIPGEGKTTTTVNLALAIAETGAKVCLIEGDLRRPRALQYMGLENAAGLTDVLVGRAEIEDVLQPYTPGLHVLGCGPIPPNPSELLGSAAMKRLLHHLEETYDFVIIDAPPLLAVTDAAILSTAVDGTIVIVGTGLVRREQLSGALASLERVEGNVVGLVLNRLPVKGPDAYRYSYESYAPELPEVASEQTRKRRRQLVKSRKRG